MKISIESCEAAAMTAAFQRIHIIINPASGQDEPILNTLNRVFQKHGVWWDVSITHAFGDGARLARAALAAGADLIASYGGDGTSLDVANGLVGTDTPLMVLPGGTANALAHELNIPLTLQKAAEAIFDSSIQAIDVGQAGDQYFILRADTGLTTQIMEESSREMKDRYGVLAYVFTGLRLVTNNVRHRYSLTLDGQDVETEGIACVITNANKVGALELTLSPDVHTADGLLDVFIFNDVGESLLSAAAHVVRLQDGVATTFQHWQVKEVTIRTDTPQPVRADGEPFGETPIRFQVVPNALKVLVPRS
jgi:diacylglycerol kinase (ATP)